MTRRIVIAILATVVGTLVVAGVVTIVIARSQAKGSTEEVLRQQAESLAVVGAAVDAATPRDSTGARQLLRQVRRALRVDGVEFVVIDDAGRVIGNLPDGISPDDLDVTALRAGGTLSGSEGSIVFAAAPRQRPNSTVVAVVTREATSTIGDAVPWFALASLLTVALGMAVAVLVGRRLARPVDAAAGVAVRIADGDLGARIPSPPDDRHDELAELARSINSMAASLEQSKQAERQFLLAISHDLRTPLTSIGGYAGAITDGTMADAAAAAEVILAESGRLERLVSDLLDLARLDAHRFSLFPVEHDLRSPLDDAVRAIAPVAARQDLTVTVITAEAGHGAPLRVVADQDRVRQLVGNLLENAARYARSNIEIRVFAERTDAVVQVDDDGPGIAPEDRARELNRMYASRPSPARPEIGTGLGLTIVQQLAEAMGGSVRIDDAAIGGARVEVRLPHLGSEVAPAPEDP